VKVLEDDQTPTIGGSDSQEAKDGLAEHDDRVVRTFDALVAPLGYEPSESCPKRREFGRIGRSARANRGAERFCERAIRNRALRLYCSSAENDHGALFCRGRCFTNEARLPDTGLTEQEYCAAASPLDVYERIIDGAEFPIPPDDRGAE